MSFAVPEPYVWEDSFRVFYEAIDEEHRGLFVGIFNCGAQPGDAALVKTLIDAVEAHFATEEEMFRKAKYENLVSHAKIHSDFVAKLKTLTLPLSNDTIQFAKQWLVDHIKIIDFKYKGKL